MRVEVQTGSWTTLENEKLPQCMRNNVSGVANGALGYPTYTFLPVRSISPYLPSKAHLSRTLEHSRDPISYCTEHQRESLVEQRPRYWVPLNPARRCSAAAGSSCFLYSVSFLRATASFNLGPRPKNVLTLTFKALRVLGAQRYWPQKLAPSCSSLRCARMLSITDSTFVSTTMPAITISSMM